MSAEAADRYGYDVAVVGAGPAGSSIAAALAGEGWHVLLVERDGFPRHKVCGEFLSPEAQATLQGLGLYQAIAALAPVPLHATVLTSRHARLRRPLPGTAWGLSRYALDAGLANAAVERGVELWTETTATGQIAQGRQIELRLRRRGHAQVVEARAVIMACGRLRLPGLFSRPAAAKAHPRSRFVGVKCHYEGVVPAQQVELFFFRGGYAGLNPVEGGRTNLCLLASYQAFAQAGRSIPTMLAAAAAGNRALAERLSSACAVEGSACAVAPVDTYRPSEPWDGVAQVGDAAAMLPPLCGDGMAMALRSAEICAPLADAYLRGTLPLPAWAELYRRAWCAEFDRRIEIGRWLQRLLQIPILSDGLLGAGNFFPKVADYLVASTRGKAPAFPSSGYPMA